MHKQFLWIALIACLGPVACAGSQPPAEEPTEGELRIISEADAVGIIGETVRGRGATPETGWEVDIAVEDPILVDIRIGGTLYGIEWVSAQDRRAYGDALPDPDPNGQLRILPGAGDDAQAQVLVLDFRSYRYDPDADRVRHGAPGSREAESRLRRDVRDFLEYVRGQGAI